MNKLINCYRSWRLRKANAHILPFLYHLDADWVFKIVKIQRLNNVIQYEACYNHCSAYPGDWKVIDSGGPLLERKTRFSTMDKARQAVLRKKISLFNVMLDINDKTLGEYKA